MHALLLIVALASPDAGVKAKPKAPAPKAAQVPGRPPARPEPPTASKPQAYKAGAWNRAWRRSKLTLEENGDLLVGVVIQTDRGQWIEHQTLRIPADGGAITSQGQPVADKVPPALAKAL